MIGEPPDDIKTYRNPKFESRMHTLGNFLTVFTISTASASFQHLFGSIAALVFMFVYHLVERMRQNTIYFYDNKNLGPDWKQILKEDIAFAIRYSLINFGIGGIILFLAKVTKIVS